MKTQTNKTTATKPVKKTNQAASVQWVRGIEGDSGTIAGPAYVGDRLCFVKKTQTGIDSKPITVAESARRMKDGLSFESSLGLSIQTSDVGLAKWLDEVAAIAA